MPFNPKKILKNISSKPNRLTSSLAPKTKSVAIKMTPSVTPPHFCVDCIFYDFAKRNADNSSACNHDKFLGQQAALVRVDEKKCGIEGKYFKKIGKKDAELRAMAIKAAKKAAAEAEKEARKTKGKSRFGKKSYSKTEDEPKTTTKSKFKSKSKPQSGTKFKKAFRSFGKLR